MNTEGQTDFVLDTLTPAKSGNVDKLQQNSTGTSSETRRFSSKTKTGNVNKVRQSSIDAPNQERRFLTNIKTGSVEPLRQNQNAENKERRLSLNATTENDNITTLSSLLGTSTTSRATSPTMQEIQNLSLIVGQTSTEMMILKQHSEDSNSLQQYNLSFSDEGNNSRSQLFTERRNMIKENCQRLVAPRRKYYSSSLRFMAEERHNILYCPIPKVGSTFWKKILSISSKCGLEKQNDYSIHAKGKPRPLRKLAKAKQRSMLSKGTSMLFIRDPYARLFSGYENKIYHCNLLFWAKTGANIVKTIRGVTDYSQSKYGYDVTFSEFIKYILYLRENGKQINSHFKPMTEICDPCKHNFNFIGKLETLKEDYKYIMEYLTIKYPEINVNISDITRDSASSSMEGRVRFLYQVKKLNSKFIQIPFKNLMLRTWRDFQIRGIVSKHIPFPYENHTDVDRITNSEYLEQLFKALDQSASMIGVKSQREEALIQAYRTVSLEDMEHLRDFVKADCDILGYDNRPQKLFNRSLPLDTDFDYLAGL